MGFDQVILGQTAGSTESFLCSIQVQVLAGKLSLLKFFLNEAEYQLYVSPENLSFVYGRED